MTAASKIATAAVIISAALATHATASEVTAIHPIQALTFTTGKATGVGYFLAESGNCKLVITLADDGSITRHERLVSSGQSTRFSAGYQKIEFGCQADARAMTVRTIEAVAAAE